MYFLLKMWAFVLGAFVLHLMVRLHEAGPEMQWRFFNVIALPVFGFEPPVWHDLTKIVTMTNVNNLM